MTQVNGKPINGTQKNAINGNGNKPPSNGKVIKSPPPNNLPENNFDQSVVLRQSPIWSRAIMLTLIGLACFGFIWARYATLEQVVPATGQLKPEGKVKEVQAPVNGVVKSVYVKDGQLVKEGDLLLTFDSTTTQSEINSLKKIRASLIKENNIYRRVLGVNSPITDVGLEDLTSELPAESALLLKNRAALISENELLRLQLRDATTGKGLGIDERQRLQAAQRELNSRSTAAELEVEKIRKQLTQTQIKLVDTQASLSIQSGVLNDLEKLYKEGGISKLQYLNQKQQVQNLNAEIAQLVEEKKRLTFDIQKNLQQVTNTVAVTDKDVLDKIADNKKRIAEIDSQLMKVILENDQRIAEANSRATQAETNFRYQELRAPVSGVVFDLQAKGTGFVANTTQTLLQIVPADSLVAEVFITNKDIGFVLEKLRQAKTDKKPLQVDVRIDSFPFSEFGDIKGEVLEVGSDALPPDQIHNFYRFPAKIKLNRQFLETQGQKISLQSGMSISANIKVREERTVLDLFTDMFTKEVDGLKQVR
ncbi:MAG TPA: HlyD family efflux transporter periplasmic adaptor subunit [Nostocaceae cyanobacterium]|nr:HlyD family efflux transporter periplasmic adaptor subunit [Nostocaceae cyanobacterium]